MNSMNLLGLTALLGFLAAGCGDAPGEPNSRAVTQPATAAAVVSGYAHTLQSSKFNPGPAATQVSEFGFSKIVGRYGVLGTFVQTGWSAGVPNGDAPATTRPSLSTSGDEHNKRVLDYFTSLGLPKDQVARVNAHATVGQSGLASELVAPVKAPTFDWYSSVLSRSIQGVDVPDSFAFARFNVDDEAVFESVYWPAIPAAVVADALALQQTLGVPTSAVSFRSKLPADLATGPGTVTIRHTHMAYNGPFVAKASYDVPTSRPMSRVRHFDANAIEFELPDEQSVATQTIKP